MFKKHKVGIKGNVGWVCRDKDGNIKRYPQTLLQKLIGRPGNLMSGKNHNIVTNEGDALVADLMQETPERTKLDNSNAVIGVGTGFSEEAKATDALVAQTGSDEAMDATYPITKGDWAGANDSVVVWKATFEAADLNDTGIDEALLGNGTDTFAYAQIDPAINVAVTDTLEITWEVTFLGS